MGVGEDIDGTVVKLAIHHGQMTGAQMAQQTPQENNRVIKFYQKPHLKSWVSFFFGFFIGMVAFFVFLVIIFETLNIVIFLYYNYRYFTLIIIVLVKSLNNGKHSSNKLRII